MTALNVLMVNHEFPPLGGGGANANYYIARELVRLGHTVAVITAHCGELARREQMDGVEVLRVACMRRNQTHTCLREATFWTARASGFAAAWAREHRPDVVQCFFALPNGPVAWRAARAARRPFAIRLSGGDVPGNDPTRYTKLSRLLLPLTRRIMGAADALIVNSAGLRDLARTAFPDLDFTVIPNGVDVDEFRPAEPHERDGPLRLLCVARLIERKGLQFLLPALGSLHRDGHRFELRIIGDGPMRARLERMVAAEGLQDCVAIDGAIAHEKLPEVYRAADLLVLPSLAEGMPNVVLEAISSGLPVVGTRVPGMAELVQAGENGWLVAAGDADALRAALAEALTAGPRLGQMGRTSRHLACEMSWSRVAQAYADTWTRIVLGQHGQHVEVPYGPSQADDPGRRRRLGMPGQNQPQDQNDW